MADPPLPAVLAKAAQEPQGGAEPWTIGEAIGMGWRALKTQPGLMAATLLTDTLTSLTALLVGVLVYVVAIRGLGLRLHGVSLKALLAGAVALVILARQGMRMWNAGLWIAAGRGDRAGVGDLGRAFRAGKLLRLLAWGAILLVLLIVNAIPLLGWALIPVTMGVLLAPCYLVDGDRSLAAALRASWRASQGHKGALFLYCLSIIPILFLGLATFGVGSLAARVVTGGGFGYIYARLTGKNALPMFPPSFGARYVRALPRLSFAVLSVAFGGACFWVLELPTIRGSAWSLRDTAIRASAVLLGVGMVIALMASLLPWVLDRFEGQTFMTFVAARHVRSQKSGFLTVISVLSILGVWLSSCALSSVVSVMGGFSQDLKRKILGNNAHLVIDTVSQAPWEGSDQVLERVRGVPGVTAATPVVSGEVMVSSASNLAGVIVRGIDPETIGKVIELPKNIEVGKLDYLVDPEKLRHLPADEVIGIGPGGEQYLKGPDISTLPDDLDPAVRAAIDTTPPYRPGIIVGRELAKTLHVYVGDDVTLVSPLGDLGPMGVMPRTKKFRVAAIFYSGMYEYDASQVYTMADVAQDYFAIAGKISAIDVKVDDAENADRFTPRVADAIARPDLRVRDWREINKNLFSALKLERFATFIILSIAIMVASFCIICTLLLMVTEKGKEIAILKAIGASDGAILRTFMTEGIIIGGIGTVFGVATGLAVCTGLSWFGLRLDPDVYYIDRLPINVSGWDFFTVAIAALTICTLATIYPAQAASKLRPVDGLRYE
jgi:lipoprotein-releasing system permease protein